MELAYKCLRNDKITGIVAINDMVAFGVLDALQREGYRVPEDFSLCGFDNVTTSGYQRIQLTTVDNNTFNHGKSAFNLLLERIEGGPNDREDQPINRVEYRSRLIGARQHRASRARRPVNNSERNRIHGVRTLLPA